MDYLIIDRDSNKITNIIVSEADFAESIGAVPYYEGARIGGDYNPPLPESLKTDKIQEIKKSCEETIVSGFDADVLGRGKLHYSLTLTKQDDLKVLYQNIQAGAQSVLWHDDSRVMHEEYTAEQFLTLWNIGYSFMIMCKIYSDGLEQTAENMFDAKDQEGIENLHWGYELSDDVQAVVDTQIKMMLGIEDEALTAFKKQFGLMVKEEAEAETVSESK